MGEDSPTTRANFSVSSIIPRQLTNRMYRINLHFLSDDLKAPIHLENTSRDLDARVTLQRSCLEGRVLRSFSWNSFMLQQACQE